MSTFNSFTGQMAQIEFSLQLLIKITGGEDCSKTLEKANVGEVFPIETLISIEKKIKRLHNMAESSKKEKEIHNFKKKLFSYCGLK